MVSIVPDVGRPPRGTPKNYLVAWILALLRDAEHYGYELIRALREDYDVPCDTGGVYRTLRQLESGELIRSRWDTPEAGPERRVYALTDGGRARLREWVAALHTQRTQLDRFFGLVDRP